jgi:uncharacterized SAM-binding protein YcdF (DUF218 family)
LGKWFLALAAIATLAYSFRYPLMTSAASAWVVNEPLLKADGIVVLGGGLDSRPLIAAELYRRGLAREVLVAIPDAHPAAKLHVMPADAEVTVALLRKLGVPESAILPFGGRVASTRDEAQALRKWVELHPGYRLIIPTDPFHTRRVRYIFGRELEGLPVHIRVMSVPNERYDPLEWWKSEEAVLQFQNEIIKLAFYYLHR